MLFLGGLTAAISLSPSSSGTANAANETVVPALIEAGTVGPIPALSASVAWDPTDVDDDLFPSVGEPVYAFPARLILAAAEDPLPIMIDDIEADW